jgi:ornithine carbamoyltransferase
VLSDYMTLPEYVGDTDGLPVAYVGDGNNVCRSPFEMAPAFGLKLTVATPDAYRPDAGTLEFARENVTWTSNPVVAVPDAAVIYTDTWFRWAWRCGGPSASKRFPCFRSIGNC